LNRKGKILKLIYEEREIRVSFLGYINGNVKEKRYGRERRECSFHLHLKEEKRRGGFLVPHLNHLEKLLINVTFRSTLNSLRGRVTLTRIFLLPFYIS